MSLRDAAGWAGILGLGSLTNPAVKYRLDNAVEFLEAITNHRLMTRSASQDLYWPGRTIRVADGTCISKPGSKGADWRVHGVCDLSTGGFTNLELTDGKGAETLTRRAGRGEVRIADRGYSRAKAWHRFRQDSGKADLIVRMMWNGFHLTRQDGSAFDLIEHLATLPNDQVPREITFKPSSAGVSRRRYESSSCANHRRRRRPRTRRYTPKPAGNRRRSIRARRRSS
jgi:hypothetical protein